MPVESVVDVPGLCPPPEPYSYAVRAGDTLYLAGQVALDEAGEVVGATVGEQARQVWDNIADVLAASGSSIADVVKITYFMQDVREIAEEIEVRREVFAGRPFPARDRLSGRGPGPSRPQDGGRRDSGDRRR